MSKSSWFLISLGIFFLAIIIVFGYNRIDAGYEGIKVKHFGSKKGVDDIALVTGAVFYNRWTTSVYEFPTYVVTQDYPEFVVNSKDGSVFTADPTISVSVLEGQTPKIFKKYRKKFEKIIDAEIYNYVKNAFRDQFNTYSTDSIISSREQFEEGVKDRIYKVFEKEGFYLEELTTGITYPSSITDAINLKNKATQTAIGKENEVRITKAEAEKDIVKSNADLIIARNQDEINKLQNKNLTPLLIQQKFIEKWDGKSSLYGNSPAFFKEIN